MSGKLVENIGGGLVVVQTDKRTAAEIAQQEYTAPGPARVVVGTGGKHLRWPDGHETGPIGGEALRNALKLGAVVIGQEPVQFAYGPSQAEQHGQSVAAMNSAIEAGAKN